MILLEFVVWVVLGEKKPYLSPSWVHKISTTVGEKESGQHEVHLRSRAVLPEILGSVRIINGTSAGFSKTKWRKKVWTGAKPDSFWSVEICILAANAVFSIQAHFSLQPMSTFPMLSPCKRSLDMQAHKTWCLHGSVISLQFAPCLSSLSSDPGFGDRLLSRNLLRLPVKEPLLTGLEHSSLLACGQNCCSCADMLPSMFAHFHTGGPTADPTTVNIFSPLMWHVCCVVALRCVSAAEPPPFKRTPGSTLLRLVGREKAHQKRRQIISQWVLIFKWHPLKLKPFLSWRWLYRNERNCTSRRTAVSLYQISKEISSQRPVNCRRRTLPPRFGMHANHLLPQRSS